MPPKRKANALVPDESPTKRRTRSSGPLIETQPESITTPRPSPTKSRAKKSIAASTSATKPRRRPPSTKISNDESYESLKENEKSTDDLFGDEVVNDSEDELMLLPSKTPRATSPMTPSRNGTPRVFMRAVEIVTPLKGKSKTLRDNSGSPVPTQRKRELKESRVHHEAYIALPISPTKRQKHNPSSIASPSKKAITTPQASPSKKITPPHASPSRLPRVLPPHLHRCLNMQKSAILRALQSPPDLALVGDEDDEDDEPPTNEVAFQQLTDLLNGTVVRGEGNSCLLLGPRGSGKSRLVERCISNLPDRPIILRLSGWAQYNDRLAMREIAYQLTQQTGTSFLSPDDDDDPTPGADEEEPNPFLDIDTNIVSVPLPPPSHLPALISVLPALARPTLVILDAFDLFAFHARQSLLYCLLDTVQSCRAGPGRKGVGVIGVTSRVDTVNLLEKRVKSRFSGRIVRTAAPRGLNDWIGLARGILCVPVEGGEGEGEEWKEMWEAGVDRFLADKTVVDTLNETFSVTRDVRMLSRILTASILELSPSSPFPLPSQLAAAATIQRSRPRFPFLHALPYPSICILIAAMHTHTAGHDFVTFEMLHECFRDQVRASTSAPVQINGGSIGMVRCTREVLMSAFEGLVSARIFVCVVGPSPSIAKEFVRHRCTVSHEEVKKAVNKTGQTNLKKWLNKAQ